MTAPEFGGRTTEGTSAGRRLYELLERARHRSMKGACVEVWTKVFDLPSSSSSYDVAMLLGFAMREVAQFEEECHSNGIRLATYQPVVRGLQRAFVIDGLRDEFTNVVWGNVPDHLWGIFDGIVHSAPAPEPRVSQRDLVRVRQLIASIRASLDADPPLRGAARRMVETIIAGLEVSLSASLIGGTAEIARGVIQANVLWQASRDAVSANVSHPAVRHTGKLIRRLTRIAQKVESGRKLLTSTRDLVVVAISFGALSKIIEPNTATVWIAGLQSVSTLLERLLPPGDGDRPLLSPPPLPKRLPPGDPPEPTAPDSDGRAT